MDFNIEEELIKRGFNLDFEKDERSSYLNGNLSVTLHWDGDLLNEEGYCISMTIKYLHRFSVEDGTIYFGKRPENIEDFNSLFERLEI
jgi:hypothetical protein